MGPFTRGVPVTPTGSTRHTHQKFPPYPRTAGDLCIISFLPLQGEVPKAEGVLLHQVLSGTRAGRSPLYLRCRPGNKCFPGRSVVR